MTLTGMNPGEVRQLAEQLRRGAEHVHSIVSAVDILVRNSGWNGRDADMFKHQWWPIHRRALMQAAESVSGLGRSAQNNADEQERASSVNGTGGGSPAVTALSGSADVVATSVGTSGSSTSPPSSTSMSAGVHTTIDWARNVQLSNPSGYDQECLRFVSNAWAASGDNSLSGYYNPQAFIAAHGDRLQHSFPPPAGAAVFWRADAWNEDGHVQLSLGDGTSISTSSADGDGIHVSDIAARNKEKSASYAGWLPLQ